MTKLTKISGFPEWLPEEKLLEDCLIELIRGIFASHGFTPIETPAVEWMSTLSAKGDLDKEVYAVRRAKADAKDSEAELGLHFDLTYPFARYVAQHFNELTFPFRRYQMQKSWRGERPQRGRFREFYQFDVDVIARDELPLACDAEVITILLKSFKALGLGPFVLKLNNRKILHGFYRSLGLDDAAQHAAVIVVDKLDKIGADGVRKELETATKVTGDVAKRILELTTVRAAVGELRAKLAPLGVKDALFEEGVAELECVVGLIPTGLRELVEIDLSMARGFTYYTGPIFEVRLPNHPEYGSVGSGGRYAELASEFINQKLPGVGASIGFTRLMDLILTKQLKTAHRRCPTQVLVTVADEAARSNANEIAEQIRAAGIATEVFYKSPKFGKQIEYADHKRIPYVLFVQDSGKFELKNIESKEAQLLSSIGEVTAKIAK